MHMQSDPIAPHPTHGIGIGIASVRARFGMMAVGYAALAGTLDREAADRAARAVFLQFGAGHELTVEFERFLDVLPETHGQQSLLTEAGDRLIMAVRRSTWPKVDARADIHG